MAVAAASRNATSSRSGLADVGSGLGLSRVKPRGGGGTAASAARRSKMADFGGGATQSQPYPTRSHADLGLGLHHGIQRRQEPHPRQYTMSKMHSALVF